MDNKQTALAFFKDFSEALARKKGLRASVERYATHDCIFWIPGFGDVKNMLDDANDLIGSVITDDGIRLDVSGVTAEGDRVAIEAESHATLLNGSSYNNRYHYLVTLRNGKIAEVKEYNDTAHAQKIFGFLTDEHRAL